MNRGPILRPYQSEAVAAVLEGWDQPSPGAIQLATGLGKTVILSELGRINLRAFGMRTCVFVHRDELVKQTVDKFAAADPDMAIGIVQGPSMGIYGDVVVASIQTLARRLNKIPPGQFPRIIVDECHHAAAKSYQAALSHFGAYDPASGTRTLGVTATMARGDRQGLGAAWPGGVWYERGIPWGVENGYLVPAEVRTVTLPGLNTDKVRKAIDGDLAAGDLGKAMSTVHAGERIAEAYARFGRDSMGRLRRAISFAPTIEVAQAWAADYEAVGARTVVITGDTPIHQRQAAYRDVAAGRKDVLSSVMVLTEGFDLPAVEVAIVGRPTKSMPLLTQMIGRVLRPSPSTGKEAALLLDVVGALGGGLARSFDLSIPGPDKPVAPEPDPDEERGRRHERIVVAPPRELGWLAMDLTGRPLKAARRKSGYAEPPWLRTYGGVSFLPATHEYPYRILCHVVDGVDTPWWRKHKDEAQPEPLELAEGGDPRDLHPGYPSAWDAMPPSQAQAELMIRLNLGAAATKAQASNVLEVHFASRELDRFARPKLVGPVAPPPGLS